MRVLVVKRAGLSHLYHAIHFVLGQTLHGQRRLNFNTVLNWTFFPLSLKKHTVTWYFINLSLFSFLILCDSSNEQNMCRKLKSCFSFQSLHNMIVIIDEFALN